MELMGGYIPCQVEKSACVGTDWNRELRPRQRAPCYCYCSVAKSCPPLFDHMDCSLPGSSAHGISQARILEWVAISFSRGSSWPRDRNCTSCTGRILYNWATWEAQRASAQFSSSVVSNSLRPHGLQHTRLPCPSPTSGGYSNSCPSSRWCHPTISSSVIPCSSHFQSSPASESLPMSQFFASGGQSIGVSATASRAPSGVQILQVLFSCICTLPSTL